MHLLLLIVLLIAECGLLVWLVFVFISNFVSVAYGAPYVPMERYRISKILAFGQLGPADIFYDLGSGDGRILIRASKEFRVLKARGFEIAPWPYWKSRWRIFRSGLKNIQVNNQSFFDGDLSEATCVYAYLMPKMMGRTAAVLERILKPGARVICPAFQIDTEKHAGLKLIKSEKIGKLTAYLYEKI